MKFEILSFNDGAHIPKEFAFCAPAQEGHVKMGKNRNPHLRWLNIPSGARSLALLCVDVDVPSVGDHVNKEDVMIAKDLPRIDFYHWVLVDIPLSISEIKAGEDSSGITVRGKPLGATPYGIRGINDYTNWFVDDKEMMGQYSGYDGPCPPWNDERLHHYHFRLYALDVNTLGLKGNFDGRTVETAMQGHILEQKEWVGIYTLNPTIFSEK